MPLKFCRKCGKLFFTDMEGMARERKQFCSTTCQETSHWTKGKKARSDAGFVERLLDKSLADLRKRVATPAVRERLTRIQTDWANWQKVRHNIRKIEMRAKGHGDKGGSL
jgi:hypothetical protein